MTPQGAGKSAQGREVVVRHDPRRGDEAPGLNPLPELAADHLRQRQHAILSPGAEQLRGERVGYAIGVVEAVAVARNLAGVVDRVVGCRAGHESDEGVAVEVGQEVVADSGRAVRPLAQRADEAAVELGPQ